MDLRAYYIQAAEAAAPAVHAEDDDDVVELTPKAVLLKLEVQAGTAASVPASRKGGGLSSLGLGNAEAGSGGHDLTCPECGKTFLSDKAMYGHLRSHPERGYKGATRPAATAGPAAVAGNKKPRKVPRKEAHELPAVNMSAAVAAAGAKQQREDDELLTKWPVTAKRGRASSTPSAGSAPVAAVQSSSWCSEEEEAAMILLEMASGGTTTETQRPLQPVHVRDAKSQIPDVEQPMLLDRAAQNQMPELLPLMPPDHSACAVMAHQQTPEAGPQIVQAELAPEVVIVESQTPEEVTELTKHLEIPTKAVVVVVRHKSTPANQQPIAPGSGAKKRRVLDPKQTPGTASPEAANVKPPVRRIPSPASDKKHECLTCGKSFPTHQALGGHMAGHNKGGGKHGERHEDLAVVQAMHNILAHRKKSSNAIIGGTGVADGAVAGAGREGAVAGAGREGAVTSAGQEGAVVGAGQVGAVTVAGHESAVGAGGQKERHDVQPPAPPMAQSAAPHVCPECNMTFRSGQALGGHKRKHWFPEKQQARAALVAAARNFDLNELPSDAEGKNQP